jgi:hypothetical protein
LKLEQLQRFNYRCFANCAARLITKCEPSQNWRSAEFDAGQMHKSNRLLLRSPTWACNAGDTHCNMGARIRKSTFGHCQGNLIAHSSVAFDQFSGHVQEF